MSTHYKTIYSTLMPPWKLSATPFMIIVSRNATHVSLLGISVLPLALNLFVKLYADVGDTRDWGRTCISWYESQVLSPLEPIIRPFAQCPLGCMCHPECYVDYYLCAKWTEKGAVWLDYDCCASISTRLVTMSRCWGSNMLGIFFVLT